MQFFGQILDVRVEHAQVHKMKPFRDPAFTYKIYQNQAKPTPRGQLIQKSETHDGDSTRWTGIEFDPTSKWIRLSLAPQIATGFSIISEASTFKSSMFWPRLRSALEHSKQVEDISWMVLQGWLSQHETLGRMEYEDLNLCEYWVTN